MRMFTSIVLIGGLVAFVGCNKESGGPGVNATTAPGATENKKKEFHFEEGILVKSLSMKQSEKKDYDVTINRGAEFKETVKIKIESTDKDITVDKKEAEIKPSDTKVTIAIGATDEAAIGDHKVKITGTPETGSPLSYELTVKVSKK